MSQLASAFFNHLKWLFFLSSLFFFLCFWCILLEGRFPYKCVLLREGGALEGVSPIFNLLLLFLFLKFLKA
jgi:hypothetical protein